MSRKIKKDSNQSLKGNLRSDSELSSSHLNKVTPSEATPLPPLDQQEKPSYKPATGFECSDAGLSLVKSVYSSLPKHVKDNETPKIVIHSLIELGPKDPIEGLLCSQIMALDAQGMGQLAKAEIEGSLLCHTEAAVNLAVKLLRLKNETIETLMRYRRKGEQKVIVQHINMNDESKAIVGNLTVNGGGCNV